MTVSALLGIYQYTSSINGITYVRICFIAAPIAHLTKSPLDDEIAEALWLTPAEIEQFHTELRSPLVLAAVRDYQAGKSFPLTILADL